jgi:hypothetical protein
MLEDLRDRLARATGPDRKLDISLAPIAGWQPLKSRMHDGVFWWVEPGCDPDVSPFNSKVHTRPPEFSASRDAADTLRPDWAEYNLSTLYGIASFECPLNGGDENPPLHVRREDGNVVLAICQWRIEYELAQLPEERGHEQPR